MRPRIPNRLLATTCTDESRPSETRTTTVSSALLHYRTNESVTGSLPTTTCSSDLLVCLGKLPLRYGNGMELMLSTGQVLAADRHGAADAPIVVLLHGLSGNRQGYATLVKHLEARVEAGVLQVVNVDLRGHGQSSRATLATYDAPSYAADIAALIDALTDRSVVVVGHSLGGVVAAMLASARPDLVRGLFLEDPPFFEGDAVRRNASPVAAFFPVFVAAVQDLHDKGASLGDYEALALTHVSPDEAAARGYSLSVWDPACMQAAVDGVVWQGFNPTAVIRLPRHDPARRPGLRCCVRSRRRRPRAISEPPCSHPHGPLRCSRHSFHPTCDLPRSLGRLPGHGPLSGELFGVVPWAAPSSTD